MDADGIEGRPSTRGARLVRALGKAAASIASSIALIIAISFVIVLPLWSLATANRSVYSLAFGSALALAAAFYFVKSWRRRAAIRARKRRIAP